jgi:hypothetical protein
MINGGVLETVSIDRIVLDTANPRIRKFIEMYGDTPTAEQIFLALGAGGDDVNAGEATTFEKLRNSIRTNGGVIQPVILNRQSDGTLVCIEGNTRVAIYKEFLDNGDEGKWETIPALVFEQLDDAAVDAIRLQVHLVGPRPWDPYSKAKYLHYLRTRQHMSFGAIVDFCGGRQKDILESINAYEDMERYFRKVVPDDGTFDTRRFSGFVELQKPGIKQAISETGFSLTDFAQWIYDRRLYPLEHVRLLPKILRNPRAQDIFIKRGSREAEKVLDHPALDKALLEADLSQLARALRQAIDQLPYEQTRRLKENPGDDTNQYLLEAFDALKAFLTDVGLVN